MTLSFDLKTHRIVCLAYPLGAPESELLASNGSIEIIAAEQLLLMKRHLVGAEIILYNEAIVPRQTDILLLLVPLPLVPMSLMEKFARVVYYFDDLTVHKWRQDESYSQRVAKLKAILHPLKAEAEELRRHTGIFTAHVPWSIARLPQDVAQKSARPSIFVDMDDRSVYTDSLVSAAKFIESISEVGADIYVPERGLSHIPEGLRPRVNSVRFMPHEQFLRFVGLAWYYASGIRGSYEYVVLESAKLGCGLISLFSAVKPEHSSRSQFLAFNGERTFPGLLEESISQFDPSRILREASVLYPEDAVSRIPAVFGEAFQ
jgi:hypothetical protein